MAEKRYTFVFLIALFVALAATAGVFRALRAIREGSHVAMAQVVVANRDIPEGQQLERRDLETAVWPAASVPAGAFASGDSLVGRVTRVSVFTGEPIVPGRLAPVGTGAGIEVKITPGKRAMAIRIDEVAGMAGLIQPNSRVDIMVSMRDESSGSQSGSQSGKRVAKLFMENMRILSIGTQVYRDENGKPIRAASATLEVTPEEAERLAIAVGTGSIQLVLRGYGDPDSIKTRGATSSDVLSQLRSAPVYTPPAADPPAPARHHAVAAKPAPAPPAPAPVVVARPKPKSPDSVTVQVFRAGKVSQQHFERDSAAADSASQ
jgi:pilus assembly protein CpaB